MNSKENSFVNNNDNSLNLNLEIQNLRAEMIEREHLIQKLTDEITIIKNKVNNNTTSNNRSFSTPKTSRINYDPIKIKNKKVAVSNQKIEKIENKPNIALNSTRELIKKDKLKADVIKDNKENLSIEDVETLNFL